MQHKTELTPLRSLLLWPLVPVVVAPRVRSRRQRIVVLAITIARLMGAGAMAALVLAGWLANDSLMFVGWLVILPWLIGALADLGRMLNRAWERI
jgi:hypothetical protein